MGYSPRSRKELDMTEGLSFIYLFFCCTGLHCGAHALDCSMWPPLLSQCMGSMVAAYGLL